MKRMLMLCALGAFLLTAQEANPAPAPAPAPRPNVSCVGDLPSPEQLTQFFTCLNNKREWCLEQVHIAEVSCGKNSPKYARLAHLYADLRFSANNILDVFSDELRSKEPAAVLADRIEHFKQLFSDFQAKTQAFDDCVTDYPDCTLTKSRAAILALVAPIIIESFTKNLTTMVPTWFGNAKRDRIAFADNLRRQRWNSTAEAPAKP